MTLARPKTVKRAVCACCGKTVPAAGDRLPPGWTWDSTDPASDWAFCLHCDPSQSARALTIMKRHGLYVMPIGKTGRGWVLAAAGFEIEHQFLLAHHAPFVTPLEAILTYAEWKGW